MELERRHSEHVAAVAEKTGSRTIAMAAGGAAIGAFFGPEGAVLGAIIGALAGIAVGHDHTNSGHQTPAE